MTENHSLPDCPVEAYAESLRLRENQIKGLRSWLAHKDTVRAADVLQVLSGLVTQADNLDETDKRDRIDCDGVKWQWLGDDEVWVANGDYARGSLAAIDRRYGPLRFADEETDAMSNDKAGDGDE